MMMTAMAISPMMRNVLSVATMLPTDVMASDTATIAPTIVPMIRRMSPLCALGPLAGHGRAFVILTLDQREMTGPGTGTRPADGRSSFRRILVPVRSPGESGQALAMAARLCGMTNGVLRLVHVRTCDPPLRRADRFYRETTGDAAQPGQAVPRHNLRRRFLWTVLWASCERSCVVHTPATAHGGI